MKKFQFHKTKSNKLFQLMKQKRRSYQIYKKIHSENWTPHASLCGGSRDDQYTKLGFIIENFMSVRYNSGDA